MPKLTPVQGNPFEARQPKLTPVQGNPFASEEEFGVGPIVPGESISAITGQEVTSQQLPESGMNMKYSDTEQYVRPLLEGGGMAVGEFGGTLASPIAGPTAIPAGGGYGYAVGKTISDVAYGKSPKTIKGQLTQPLKDMKTGFQISAAGAGAGAALAKGANYALSKVPKDYPAELYQGAAKFTKKNLPKFGDRLQRAKTALKNEILPNYKGVDKALDKIKTLKGQVDDIVNGLTLEGKRVKSSDLFKGTDKLRREYMHGRGKSSMKDIDKVVDDVLFGVEGLEKNGTLSPTEVNKIKRKLYDYINFTREGATPAGEATEKAIAEQGKLSLEFLDDTIKELNTKMGGLIDLLEALPQAADRIGKRDLVGIGMPIKLAAGAQYGPAGKAIGAGAAISDIPQVKARTAMALEKLIGKKVNPNNVLTSAVKAKTVEKMADQQTKEKPKEAKYGGINPETGEMEYFDEDYNKL